MIEVTKRIIKSGKIFRCIRWPFTAVPRGSLIISLIEMLMVSDIYITCSGGPTYDRRAITLLLCGECI
jgi:hypothetical protein